MGRPTDDNKTKYIGIRINAETLDFLRQNGGNVSEIVRNLLYNYVKQNNGSVKHKNGNVKQNTDNSVKQNESFVKQYDSLKAKFDLLHSRVRPEADKYFKNEQYTMLEIVPLGYKGINTTSESTNTELDNTIKNIKSMLPFMNITYESFMKLIENGLTDLSLTVENGKLKSKNVDLKLDKFEEMCKQIGIGQQEAINKTVSSMQKGKW